MVAPHVNVFLPNPRAISDLSSGSFESLVLLGFMPSCCHPFSVGSPFLCYAVKYVGVPLGSFQPYTFPGSSHLLT